MKKISLVLAFVLCTAFLLTGCGHKKPDAGYVLKTDLKGAAVGIVDGLTTETQVRDNIENADLKTFASIDEGVSALREKKINALILDASSASSVLEKNGDLGQMIEKLVDKSYIAAARMPDDDPNNDFTLQIDATISRIESNGVYDALYSKYFGGDAPESSDFTYNTGKVAGRTLVVGVAEDNKPFSYTDASGRYIGFDVEFANEVAQTWGATLEIRAYPREKLINAAQSGEVTMALGRITAFDSKNAESNLFFSAPYYDASQIVILNAEDVGKNPLFENLTK